MHERERRDGLSLLGERERDQERDLLCASSRFNSSKCRVECKVIIVLPFQVPAHLIVMYI